MDTPSRRSVSRAGYLTSSAKVLSCRSVAMCSGVLSVLIPGVLVCFCECPNPPTIDRNARPTPHIPVNDKSKREDRTFSREDFPFDKERNVYVCPAGKVLTWPAMGRHSTTGPGHAIAVAAHSNRSAVRRRRCAESRAASTNRPAMLPGQWQRPKHSSSFAVIESASRCCSPISSSFSGSAGCAYGGQGVPSSSSRWPLSLRT
jgi:hypothetical protein